MMPYCYVILHFSMNVLVGQQRQGCLRLRLYMHLDEDDHMKLKMKEKKSKYIIPFLVKKSYLIFE